MGLTLLIVYLPRIPGNDELLWNIACVTVSIMTSLLAPCIVRSFVTTLTDLPDLRATVTDSAEATHQDAIGWFGLLQFIIGILDIVSDFGLCVSLVGCGMWWLLLSSVLSFAVSSGVTLYLGFTILAAVQRGNTRAQAWYMQHNALATFIVLASMCRIESMSVLRLRLCGKMLIDFPMQYKHFHFLLFCGWYHTVLVDIPHILVAVATLVSSSGCQHESWMPHGLADTFAIASIIFSCASMFWSAVSRMGQRVAREANRDASHGLEQPIQTGSE
jgi:hypothetical protein